MFLIDKIDPLIFFLSLFLGLFLTYSLSPTPDVIVKYPTPENCSKLIFKDDADNCFKFISSKVKCPDKKGQIKTIPVQISNKKKESLKN
jgi:hypothetical protein